jgi:hypothetical protein
MQSGYDITQATTSNTWTLTDTLLVVEDGAIYRITGSLLQSLVNGATNPTESVVTKAATYTIASGDNIIISDTDTAGALIAFNLAAPTTYWDSTNLKTEVFTVTNSGATYATTVTPATGTINGASSISLAAGASGEIYTDGSNFFVRGL